MGAGRKSRNGVMLVKKQEWFALLIAQGINNGFFAVSSGIGAGWV